MEPTKVRVLKLQSLQVFVAAEVLGREVLGVDERPVLPSCVWSKLLRGKKRGLLQGESVPMQLVVLSLPGRLKLSDGLSLSRLGALHSQELRHQLRDLRHRLCEHSVQGPHGFHGFCRHDAMRES